MRFVLVRTGRAARQRLFDRPSHARVAVTQQRGAVAATEVDVLAAVQVPDAAAVGAVDEQGVAQRPVEPRRRRYAPGEILARPAVLLLNAGHWFNLGLRSPSPPYSGERGWGEGASMTWPPSPHPGTLSPQGGGERN